MINVARSAEKRRI